MLEALLELDQLIDREIDTVEERMKLLKDSGEELTVAIGQARTPDDLKKIMDHIHTLSTMLKPGTNPYMHLAQNISSHNDTIRKLTE